MRDRLKRMMGFVAALVQERRATVVTTIGAGVWLLIVVTAMAVLNAYANRPGDFQAAPATWPVDSKIVFDRGRPNLLLIAHPRCPCTRATIGELDVLMARAQGRVTAHVIFIQPAATTEDWAQTDLWRAASAIPGVKVLCDAEGAEARRFNAATSGEALLYDRDGQLLFQGGITISRGHAGDNLGRSAILDLLDHKLGGKMTPVFGCPLFAATSQKGGVACKK